MVNSGLEVSVGDTVPAVVLYVDLNKQCLELAVTPQLVNDVVKRTTAKAKPEQVRLVSCNWYV